MYPEASLPEILDSQFISPETEQALIDYVVEPE